MSSDTVTILIVVGISVVMCLGALVVFGMGAYFIVLRPNIERTKVVNQNWEAFAREKSLTFTKGARPMISGLYQGQLVKLAVINPDYDFDGPVRVTGRTTKSNFLLTRVSAEVKEADLELKVYKRGLIEIAENGQGHGLGNEAFDARFRSHCSSADRLKSILDPEIQSALLERQIHSLHINKGTLIINAVGVESRPEVLEAFLELACKIADKIVDR